MKFAIALFCVLISFNLTAQEEEFAKVGEGEPFYVEEDEDLEIIDIPKSIPENFRHYKELSSFYSGYMVELLVADFPVGRNHSLLSKYGKVYFDINKETGQHHYLLLIPFEDDDISLNFFETVIKPHAPDSKLLFREVKKKKRCKSCFNKF